MWRVTLLPPRSELLVPRVQSRTLEPLARLHPSWWFSQESRDAGRGWVRVDRALLERRQSVHGHVQRAMGTRGARGRPGPTPDRDRSLAASGLASAEDRGFEPLRVFSPTRFPIVRPRPLGESSVPGV